jgi:hypothetical protein
MEWIEQGQWEGCYIKIERKETYGTTQNKVYTCTGWYQEEKQDLSSRESCGKKEEIGECSSVYLYKLDDMQEEE